MRRRNAQDLRALVAPPLPLTLEPLEEGQREGVWKSVMGGEGRSAQCQLSLWRAAQPGAGSRERKAKHQGAPESREGPVRPGEKAFFRKSPVA